MTTITQAKEGSVFGGILLMAGSCIGAGMLALPMVTAAGGFGPSLVMFLIAWAFMTLSGFLLLEVNLACGYNFSLISLAQKTLGTFGKVCCWVLFLFLFYSLSVAYVSASGTILNSMLGIPSFVGSSLFVGVFAVVLYFGMRQVDYLNRFLMLGLVASYIALVLFGASHIEPKNLMGSNWKYAIFAMPVLIVSFGFHNMIPSLAMYMKGNRKKLRQTLLVGSLIPLLFNVVWQFVVLGRGASALTGSFAASSFALFAIVTSFLAQSLSLVDFLSDGLKVGKKGASRAFLITLSMLPPAFFAFLNPGIFTRALSWAGGFSAVILFGVLPALMVWKLRRNGAYTPLLPGGRLLLSAILIVAVSIFALQCAQEFMNA